AIPLGAVSRARRGTDDAAAQRGSMGRTRNRWGSWWPLPASVGGWGRVATLVLVVAWAHDAVAALRHFQCFEVRRRSFSAGSFTLEDRFGTSRAGVDRPQRLCAPANVKGQDPGAIADPARLTGYDIARAFQPVPGLPVTDEFGSLVLDVLAPDRLMVPTVAGAGPVPDTVDHFQCYRIRRAVGS